MRLLPSSLSGRLLAAAVLFVVLAIAIAGGAMTVILGHFVRGQLDSRLDSQIEAVADALRLAPDGALELAVRLDGPPFDRPGRGWYWQASIGERAVSSISLGPERLSILADGKLSPPPPERFPGSTRPGPDRPRPADVAGPRGEVLFGRSADRLVSGQPVRVIAAAPRQAVSGPLRDALLPLLGAMIALGLVLLLALVLQVRLGLRPLGQLREAVAAVRNGQSDRLPTEQPAEVAPLVNEINSLLDRNEVGLERARRHVANLAHGLKTPLATMSVTLAESGREYDRALLPLVGTMERLIRHHLARARSAALGAAARQRVDLEPRLHDLASAMGKIHAPRPVRFQLEGPAPFPVACDAQDCDELFGNLLDNAFRHAAGLVWIKLETGSDEARILLEDDGAGLPAERMAQALQPGLRLDEAQPGYGFGLPIAAEIAELYGGGLALSASGLGGLKVTVRLPL